MTTIITSASKTRFKDSSEQPIRNGELNRAIRHIESIDSSLSVELTQEEFEDYEGHDELVKTSIPDSDLWPLGKVNDLITWLKENDLLDSKPEEKEQDNITDALKAIQSVGGIDAVKQQLLLAVKNYAYEVSLFDDTNDSANNARVIVKEVYSVIDDPSAND